MEKIQSQIIEKTINGLQKDMIDFQGVIFFGIMVNKFNQPYLLEYNTRFGDPEIQSISMRLKSDFLQLIHATSTKNLSFANLEFYQNKKAICLILASKGYPENYPKDTHIKNLNEFENSEDFYIFHAATKTQNNQILANGGRVLSLVAIGSTYEECRNKVYQIAEEIEWDQNTIEKILVLIFKSFFKKYFTKFSHWFLTFYIKFFLLFFLKGFDY